LVEKYEKFPQGVNFEIVNKKEDKYIVRVWERGSGITLACGTGATAVAAISKKLYLFDDVIHMNFPGGDLSCNCSKKSSINMEGPIEYIGSGTYNINL
jgi:diaminopimelate epimerase